MSRLLLLAIFVVQIGHVGLSQSSRSTTPDFYVVDQSQHVNTYENDFNVGGQFVFASRPIHAEVNTATCPTCPFVAPHGDYTGSDAFSYYYYTPSDSPPESNTSDVLLLLIGNSDRQNAGESCFVVGKPVNVTNGNMWIKHRDFEMPGKGLPITITRFYNSIVQETGLFGYGWSSEYDERLVFVDNRMVQFNRANGKATFFGRYNTSQAFFSASPDLAANLIQNQNGTYELTSKEGTSRTFDSAGKLQSIRDRNGNITALTYDSNGRLITITDPSGRVLTVTPNSNGTIAQISYAMGPIANYEYFANTTLLKTVTYPDGSKFNFEYTTVGTKTLLTTVKDALDNVVEFHEYDGQGRAITSETHGGTEKFTLSYDSPPGTEPNSLGETTVTDALQRVTKYRFYRKYGTNVVAQTEGVCGGCGGTSELTNYEYDTGNSSLNLKKKTDALGRQTTYTYDANRNLIQQTDPLGTQKWTYNQFGEVLTFKDRVDSQNPDPNVNTIVNTYDPNGNLLTTKDALGNITTFTYTSAGQLATLTDARGNKTTLLHDTQGRLTRITDARNKNTNFGYNARARLTSVTNALSQTTFIEYDLNSRLKKIVFPDSNYVENEYDLAGRRTSFRNARGNITSFAYDSAYRLIGVTDPLNHTSTYGYDLMSQLTSRTDALGNTTNFEYDAFQRLKKVIYPPETGVATRLEESLTYDKVGNVKTRTDTGGRVTSYDYDTLNRLIKITDAVLKTTQFEYNLRSQLTKVKDAIDQEYIFTYDPLGRVLTETRAGSTRTFVYDAVGNRTMRTDYLGRKTAYDYDVLNRLTEIEYLPTLVTGGLPQPNGFPRNSVTYEYDDLSRLVSAVNSVGTVAFTYDNRGRVKTETDVHGRLMEYSYDPNGNRAQLKLDGSVHTTYAYDAADRLTTLADDLGQSFVYGYDVADRLISRAMPNGVTTTYEYDGMSRLKRLKDQGPGGPLFDRQYSYNAANQISQIAELTGTRFYGYDNMDRLTSVTDAASGNESYAFDAVGNRTSSHLSNTYSYQPFNRLSETETGTYGFDGNGNTVSKVKGSKRWSLTWDYENRLTQAWDRKTRVRYHYDALGRRVARYAGAGGSTKYTHDGMDVLVDDDSGAVTKYLNGPGIDNKLWSKTGSAVNYFLADHLGSTNGLTDANGSLTASNSYDAFGNPRNAAFPTRYQFTGRDYDPLARLQYSRARFYDPRLGRFISEDPIGFAGGDVNLYGYVRNQPQWFRDPLGLQPGGDVLTNPDILRTAAQTLATAGGAILTMGGAVVSSPIAVGAGGLVIGGAIGLPIGNYTANHPSNPFVNGGWNPFGTPPPMLPPFPISPPLNPGSPARPRCEPAPKSQPIARSPSVPVPMPTPNREGCAEEISGCVQLCAEAQFDPNRKGVWGGSRKACLESCIPDRCKAGFKF